MTSIEVYIVELRKLLNEAIERLTAELTSGSSRTLEDYRNKVGQIYAMRAAIDMTMEAEKITQQKLNGS